MEESKELQGFYKIFRAVIYISVLMEFFEACVMDAAVGDDGALGHGAIAFGDAGHQRHVLLDEQQRGDDHQRGRGPEGVERTTEAHHVEPHQQSGDQQRDVGVQAGGGSESEAGD